MRVILFDIDCLRPDHLGCYGYARPTSPNMDRVARQGVCFDRFFCADSPCLPSRTGFASGRFGIHNGVVSNHGAGAQFRMDGRSPNGPWSHRHMLMRRLREAGYDTISVSNFADRHAAFWFCCGWSEFHTPNLKGGRETAEEVNAVALRWLRHHARRENYLLHVNYWDAHRCYRMDASWADRLRGTPRPAWPDEETIRRHQSISGRFTALGQFPDHRSPYPLMPGAVRSREDFDHLIDGYDAAIACVDHNVGVVLEELDRQGVLDDAVVLVTADHGDAFGEHGIYSDHVDADECIHRIPLIARWPGVTPPGGRCGSMLYNVDLAATLCEMLGAETPELWDGRSFAANLQGHPGLDREFLVWGHGLYGVQRAVRTRRHLMIRTWDPAGYPFEPVEIYDLEADPCQTRDLAASDPATLGRCERLLSQWVDEQKRRGPFVSDPLDAVLAERSSPRDGQ